MMSATEHLNTYAEGWTKGEAETILKAVSENYVFDDPNAGRIAKADFPSYFAKLKDTVASIRGGKSEAQFMELSEVVTQEEADALTAWCWWAIPDTPLQGSGLIKVGPEGVVSERITFYTKLPATAPDL